MGAQAFFEPHPLNIEIELQGLDLLCQCHLTAGLSDEGMAQEARQAGEHRIGRLGLFQQHQCADRIERIEQEVRVELVAQHRQLCGGRLRFQPLQPVRLLFHREKEVDRIIQRAPPAEQGQGEIQEPDQALGESRLPAPRVIDPLHPGIDRGVHQHGNKQHHRRQPPCHQRLLLDELAVDHRQDQADRKAGDGGDKDQRQQIQRLLVRECRDRAQQKRRAPARQLEVPERPVLAGEERRRLDLEHCHSPTVLTHFVANHTANRSHHRGAATARRKDYRFAREMRPPAGSISRRKWVAQSALP